MLDMLTLKEAAARCPGNVHRAAVWRWCTRGLKDPDGGRIRLRHYRVGKRIYVRESDLLDFFERMAEAHVVSDDAQPGADASPEVRREHAMAEAALESEGL